MDFVECLALDEKNSVYSLLSLCGLAIYANQNYTHQHVIEGGVKLQFEGSVITEQGVKFAIVVVKEYVVDNGIEADKMIRAFQSQVFPGMPVVLMAQDSRGIPKYRGRKDIINFLANIDPRRIPWRKYTLS